MPVMKYVPAPALEDIRVVDIYDEPAFDGVVTDAKDPDYGKPRPLMQNYQRFLLARLADEGFFEHGGKKEGIDAGELLRLARAQIKATTGKRGMHAFDDEVANRLQHVVLHPKAGHLGHLPFEHNWYDWVQCWKKLHDAEPAVLIPASEAAE